MLIAVTIIILVGMAFFVYASASIGSGVYIKAICRGRKSNRSIALTFDDGPDPEITPMLLDTLKEYNIKATFFCIGSKVVQYPHIVKRMVDEGHNVGNHTFTHAPFFPILAHAKMVKELEDTALALDNACGYQVKIFRPPFGVTNPLVASAVKRLGYTTVGWSIRSLDTVKWLSLSRVIGRVESRLSPGSIILLHDNRPRCVELVRQLAGLIYQKGYTIKRFDEIL